MTRPALSLPMRFRLTATFILVFTILLGTLPTNAATRTALVIGNGNYRSSPLSNPTNDAMDMAATLKKLGFDVIIKTNADKRDMLDAIDLFNQKLKRSDTGLFFFAGHGMQIRGSNYLIPVGVHIQRERDVEFESVNAGRVLAAMEDSGSKVNIVILDACRDNPFKRSFRSTNRGLSIMQVSGGSFVAYATSPGSVASDGDGRNGIYTKNILNHITHPELTVEEVFRNVRKDVYSETSGGQLPWDSSSLMGRVYLASSGTTIETPSAPSSIEGRLYVNTDPPNARVRVLNIKPKFYQGIKLKPGSYQIEVSAKDHEKLTKWISLPPDEEKRVNVQLKTKKKGSTDKQEIQRGWLGIGHQDLNPELAEYYGVKEPNGVLVTKVFTGDPAEKAGIRVHDIILAVDGTNVSNGKELAKKIVYSPTGYTAIITLVRNGEKRTIFVPLSTKGDIIH